MGKRRGIGAEGRRENNRSKLARSPPARTPPRVPPTKMYTKEDKENKAIDRQISTPAMIVDDVN